MGRTRSLKKGRAALVVGWVVLIERISHGALRKNSYSANDLKNKAVRQLTQSRPRLKTRQQVAFSAQPGMGRGFRNRL